MMFLRQWRWLVLLLFALLYSTLGAATKPLVSVQLTPSPQVDMSWSSHTGTLNILRRDLGSEDFNDFAPVGTTSNNIFSDTTVIAGKAYEYSISTTTSYRQEVLGFAVAVDAELIDERGAVLLVIDNTLSTDLAAELDLLEMDLVGDGWTVHRLEWGRHGTGDGVALRGAIQAEVADHPEINTLYFFGNLPMVESGYDQPDGHDNHQPHVTDLYYADLDGNWTDLQSYTFRTAQNLPGDGIYDQNTIPSDIELALGRVTLHNMTGRGKDERELMRDYIHKAFAWKHARREVPERAIFQHTNGEHHETRAYTNAMFGGNVLDGGNIGTLSQEEPVFLGYSFSSDSIASLTTPTQVLISANFKSHRHRWWESNHIMRHVLAQPDWGLNSYWGSRPQWFLYHMSGGLPVGFSMKYSVNQNYKGSSYYQHRRVYMAMVGDPTTRMHPITPPGAVMASRVGDSVELNWTASSADHLVGYHVYRSSVKTGPYTRLTATPIAATQYSDATAPAGALYYQVRAVADMADLPTGSYRNQSQGIFAFLRADGTANEPPVAMGGSYRVKSDSMIPVALAGSDPDGDAVTPIVLQNPRHGQLRWHGDRVYYQSHPGYVGEDSFTFIMSDGIAHGEPATVNVVVEPEWRTLLAWEFVSGSGDQEKYSTWNALGIASGVLSVGSGLQYIDPFPRNDHFGTRYANGSDLGPNDFIAWTLVPESDYRTSLDRITFGLFAGTSNVLNCALRVSDDGFATYDEVSLDWTSHVGRGTGDNQGILNTADLSGIARLQNATGPLEFRLYLWHNGASTDLVGLGKITGINDSASEDLVIIGTRERVDGTALLVLDRTAVESLEGESTDVRVKLSNPTSGPVVVTAARSAGDEDISVTAGGNLNFDADNWNEWQTMTIHIAADDNDLAGGATITVGGPQVVDREITVTGIERIAGQWRLDESAGTVAADSMGDHDGTHLGGPLPTAGRVGRALAWDGVDDIVEIPDFDYTLNQHFTLAFWFRHPDQSGSSDAYLFSHGDTGKSHSLAVVLKGGTGILRTVLLDANDSNLNTSLDVDAGLADDTWHHYTLVVGATGATVYIDGSVAASSGQGGDAFDPSTPIRFGADSKSNANTLNRGLLDDVRLYRTTLTSTDIDRLSTMNTESMVIHAWREFYFDDAANAGAGADTHDPLGDGIGNLVKYALGMNPLEDSTGHAHLPKSSIDHDLHPTESYITIEFSLPVPQPPNAQVVVETSSDLITWNANAVMIEEDHNDPEATRYRWRTPQALDDEANQFIRLKVTTP